MGCFAIPPELGEVWWSALHDSQVPAVIRWREGVWLQAIAGDPQTICATYWTPPQCMEALEALCTEGLMRRATVSAIEECLWASVEADGGWK
jgi:hypothetical protein